jgi:glycolate oxidase FAD binding subunit
MKDTQEAQRLVLAIQNSKLAHSALQMRSGAEIRPRVDVLFEGTEAGLTAQLEQLKLMMSAEPVAGYGRRVWSARQEICSADNKSAAEFAVAKFATLPALIADTVDTIARLAAAELRWSVVAQATGIGWVRLEGNGQVVESVLRELRAELERDGGSLVIAHRPTGMAELDAWGNAGDALPLMRAVKCQFDPGKTLNPGRFVGGI